MANARAAHARLLAAEVFQGVLELGSLGDLGGLDELLQGDFLNCTSNCDGSISSAPNCNLEGKEA